MRDILDELSFPDHVRKALDEQKFWRAKEILQGRLGSLQPSRELFEQYGVVLLHMHDLLEAGKYLFLSGRRRPEYDSAINVFLTRYGKTGLSLFSSFPASVKSRPFEDLPEQVREELRARGFVQPFRGQSLQTSRTVTPNRTSQQLVLFGCIVVFALFVISAVAGFPVVVRQLVSLFR